MTEPDATTRKVLTPFGWTCLSKNGVQWWKDEGGAAGVVVRHTSFSTDDDARKFCDVLIELLAVNRAALSHAQEQQEQPPITSETSDGYHTFGELYAYRMAYHALVVNEWAAQGKHDVHKSWRHSDGEFCFGGGWFIVVAETPMGQITNHYKTEHWDLFQLPERERGNVYDGHTPQIALDRLLRLAAFSSPPEVTR